MSIFDSINKTLSQGIDRAKFEAEKLQKTLRLQSELGDLKRQIDEKRGELGDRACDLYKAGQIQSPTLAALVQTVEALRTQVTLKEDELKQAQAEVYVEPTQHAGAQAQHVPVEVEQPATSASAPEPETQASAKTCPNCGFQMPHTARFCPSCGARVSG